MQRIVRWRTYWRGHLKKLGNNWHERVVEIWSSEGSVETLEQAFDRIFRSVHEPVRVHHKDGLSMAVDIAGRVIVRGANHDVIGVAAMVVPR